MIYLFFALASVFAAENTYTFDVQALDRIKVHCFNGKFQMIDDPSVQGIKITARTVPGRNSYSSQEIKVEKREWGIDVKCEIPSTDLQKLSVKENMDEGSLAGFEIFVRGKSIPAEVNWKWGDLYIKGWTKPSQILLEKGKLQTKDTTTDLKLNMIEGTMSVQTHKGRLNMDAYDAKMVVEGAEGPLTVANFMGAGKFVKMTGDIRITSRKGQFFVAESEGTLNFVNDTGRMEIQKFKGSIEGNTEQGQLDARLMDPAELRVKSKAGQVDIVAPKSSGARVSIVIGDGQFKVPPNLKTEYLSNVRSIRGELPGVQKGMISVQSETGKIFLRTN